MTMTIDTSGYIKIDGADTGLAVTQRGTGTVLYRREIPAGWSASFPNGQAYAEITLARVRYSLAHDHPASGNPGRAAFEEAIRAYLAQA